MSWLGTRRGTRRGPGSLGAFLYGAGLIMPLAAQPDLLEQSLEPEPDELPRVQPLSPEEALNSFSVPEGLQLDAVAVEPLIVDPVAMDFGPDGSLYVVEMRGYSENRDAAMGRVKRLVDVDGDGVFDRGSVFADGLRWPTAVIAANGGIYIGATPEVLFLADRDGDDHAEESEVVFRGFGPAEGRLNVQGLINSFRWGPDHRIYGSASSSGGRIESLREPDRSAVDLTRKDFSFSRDGTDFRAETGGSQHGLSFGLWGRRFLCHNSDHIQTAIYEEDYAEKVAPSGLPRGVVSIGAEGPAAEVFRISPEEPWRIVRTRWRVAGSVGGPIEGGGRVSGYFTSATGITVFGGDALGEDYMGSAFIGDVGSNLVHRKILRLETVPPVAQRKDPSERREFLASSDTWFRPVQFAEGPDGGLYILDMYRETIEHPWSLPDSIKSRLDLNAGNDRGRIYRLRRSSVSPTPARDWRKVGPETLLEALDHPNRWVRQTASRLLMRYPETVPELRRRARAGATALGRFHALYTLFALGALDGNSIEHGLQDQEPEVRRNALRLAVRTGLHQAILPSLSQVRNDPYLPTRFELAQAAVHLQENDRFEALSAIATSTAASPWFRHIMAASGAAVAWPLLKDAVEKNSPDAATWRERCVEILSIDLDGAMRAAHLILEKVEPVEALTLASAALEVLASQTGAEPPEALLETLRPLRDAEPWFAAHNEEGIARLAWFIRWYQDSESLETLRRCLDPEFSIAIREAAAKSLAAQGQPEALDLLLEASVHLSEATIAQLVPRIRRHPHGRRALLRAVEEGQLPAYSMAPQDIDALRNAPEIDLQKRALALWGAPYQGDRQTIIENYFPSLRLTGKADQGLNIYRQRCASCHRWGNEGARVGPDLNTMRDKPKEALLVGIVDPSREAQPTHYLTHLQLRNGETYSGIIDQSSSASVRLKLAGGATQTIARTAIESIQGSTQSLMPEGLESGLSQQDMADLLTFLVQER